MSQLPNNVNLNTNQGISMNPSQTAILIPANQNIQAHPQIGQLNAPSIIQLPASMNPVPTNTGNTTNIITSTNPNNTTTFILNPSTVQNLQQQPQVHQPPQLINTTQNLSQMNQIIAASPLISTQQQQTPQQLPQFQIQPPPMQSQIKPDNQQLPNGNPNSNVFGNSMPKTNGHDMSHSSTNGLNDNKSPAKGALQPVVVLDKNRLQELVKEVDPNEQLEEEVEDVLLSIADEFIDSLVSTSCTIAKHRKSSTLEVKDVQLALEKNWNMWIPGFGVDGVVGVMSGTGSGQGSGTNANLNKPKKCLATEAHKQRMALIKKAIKKF